MERLSLPTSYPQGTLGVAVSGGVDSMVLLHALHRLGLPLVALTVEHGIRAAESVQDKLFVIQQCADMGIPCLSHEVDAPAYAREQHIGLEQAARALRYQWFDSLLAAGTVCAIATAHHKDDQAETILMHILRGAGLQGLKGIGNRKGYIRPLLRADRQAIESYARDNDIAYRVDSTNALPDYTRNWLRLSLLPQIEQKYPAYRDALARLSQAAQEQLALLDSLSTPCEVGDDWVSLPWSAMVGPTALVKYNIQQAVRTFDHGIDFEADHLQAILELLDKPNGKSICLPFGLCAAKAKDALYLWRDTPLPAPIPFGVGTLTWGTRRYTVRPYREGDKRRFDLDAIPVGAVLRAPQAGDRIAKFGGGTKNLGDYYTDAKLPLPIRRRTPVVAVGSDVLLCALDISSAIKVTPQTTRIYTIVQEN